MITLTANCSSCGKDTPTYDLVGTQLYYPGFHLFHGVAHLCLPCFNQRMIRELGIKIELPEHECVTVSTWGNDVELQVRPWVSHNSLGLIAFDATEEERVGFAFGVSGDLTADFDDLRSELEDRIQGAVAGGPGSEPAILKFRSEGSLEEPAPPPSCADLGTASRASEVVH